MTAGAVLRAWPVAAAAGLLVVVALAAAGGAGARVGTRTIGTYVVDRGCATSGPPPAGCRPTPPAPAPTGRAAAAPVVVGLFGAFGIAVAVVLAVLALAFLVALSTAAGSISIRRRRREGEPPGTPEPGVAASIEAVRRLDAAAEAGLADLHEGADPRRAVIAAWLRLEEAAAQAGTKRRPAETPGELAERLLAGHAVSPVTLARLAGLYREARYSRHEVDERMRTEARRALERLRRELTVAAPG